MVGPLGLFPWSRIEPISLVDYLINPAAPLTDGVYALEVGPDILSVLGDGMDQDRDGITGEPTQDAYAITFIVDSLPPAPPVVTNYAMAPVVVNVTNSTLTLQGTREPGSSVWVDGVEVVPFGTGAWSVQIVLPEGSNQVALFSRDAAQNQSQTVFVNFFVDTVPPVVTGMDPSDNSFTNLPPPDLRISFVEATSGLDLAGSAHEQ